MKYVILLTEVVWFMTHFVAEIFWLKKSLLRMKHFIPTHIIDNNMKEELL